MLFTACWLRPSIPQAGKSNYSFSCFWHADWPAQVVASNPRILLAGWRFQHLFKTIKVRQLPVLPSVGSLVRLRQFQNVKLPLGYGGESPCIYKPVHLYPALLASGRFRVLNLLYPEPSATSHIYKVIST